jgi:hypothetical protein
MMMIVMSDHRIRNVPRMEMESGRMGRVQRRTTTMMM